MRNATAWPPRVRSPAGVRLRAAGCGGGARGSSLEGTSGAGSRSGKRGAQALCLRRSPLTFASPTVTIRA
ncbi:hypothetical protein MJG53_013585 [Ovis ammon polii x Ovis aries]|uniref:Uncharacterized protein n=1 Tax=Ovis ammon polii x Ovis aries TaxID=2918886 RepID=A0ACB9UJC7_9CETA|nr:hypothetical protein MJG53_013585 [Ovis ammon polii x Ovis aries]